MLLSRYGYSIPEYLSIKYSLFFRLKESAFKNMEDENKRSLIPPAFSFWLEHVSDSKNSMSFGKMCEEIGLIESKENETKISKRIKAQKAISRAKEIIKMDSKRRGKIK